ncbi:hypothetical protein BV22DRAFT_1125759 [Leucogyrophana mollusca]|uniref:Uncharacterized protein n=1 Tax=Leucogyrophana mollusca TaxID=85980 RepID=A0ACB8BUX2_9AGAM|nr:hypothetical protein BV22DRAFT_1125759 [Leucogyrophana mollusca]
MPAVASISEAGYSEEPEAIWGTVENLGEDGAMITKTVWPSEAPDEYTGLFKNLARAIRNGGELAVKWEEATQVIEMIELAYKSSAEERTIVIPKI